MFSSFNVFEQSHTTSITTLCLICNMCYGLGQLFTSNIGQCYNALLPPQQSKSKSKLRQFTEFDIITHEILEMHDKDTRSQVNYTKKFCHSELVKAQPILNAVAQQSKGSKTKINKQCIGKQIRFEYLNNNKICKVTLKIKAKRSCDRSHSPTNSSE